MCVGSSLLDYSCVCRSTVQTRNIMKNPVWLAAAAAAVYYWGPCPFFFLRFYLLSLYVYTHAQKLNTNLFWPSFILFVQGRVVLRSWTCTGHFVYRLSLFLFYSSTSGEYKGRQKNKRNIYTTLLSIYLLFVKWPPGILFCKHASKRVSTQSYPYNFRLLYV